MLRHIVLTELKQFRMIFKSSTIEIVQIFIYKYIYRNLAIDLFELSTENQLI